MSERTSTTTPPKPKADAKTAVKKLKPQAARPTAPVVRPRGMGAVRPH